MQIVREVEKDILRREEQKREEQTLIEEVKIFPIIFKSFS